MAVLLNALAELREKEQRLRDRLKAKYGIEYVINEGSPHFAGVRTADTVAVLLKWRDQSQAAARNTAESRARMQGKTAAQIKAAGDAAFNAAYYRVAPYDKTFHGVGGAFDIRIVKVGTSAEVESARKAGEAKRAEQARVARTVASAVQLREAGNVAALNAAYEIAGREGEAAGLRWGGRFSAPRDVYHFELPYAHAVVAQKFRDMQRIQVAKHEGGTTMALALLALGGGLLYYATHSGGWRSVT